MRKTLLRICSCVLAALMTFTMVGCGDKGSKGNDGRFDLSKLTPVKASEVKRENNRTIIYHNGKPYHYYGMHLRYDHLTGAADTDGDYDKYDVIFDKMMKAVKDDGWDTVVLYTGYQQLYDGEKFDFKQIEHQYKIAKKYDMKIHWNMFGYDVCGSNTYMPWQTDLEKYPPLKNSKGENVLNKKGQPIPDLSNQIFLDESFEIVQQFCAWLNVNDTDRRTVAIQLENEVNPGSQETAWMGQFKNFANHIDNLAKAVKTGPYSMVTYTNVMQGNEGLKFDGLDHAGTMHHLIDKPYLDIVGWDTYTTAANVPLKVLEYGGNLPTHVEFAPEPYIVPGQMTYCFTKGYGVAFYQMQNFISLGQGGYLAYKGGDMFVRRDGTQLIPNIISSLIGGKLEINADEMAKFNQSVKALRELICTQNLRNMNYFNNALDNVSEFSRTIAKEKITYKYKDTARQYGGAGYVLKAEDGNFYAMSSLGATFTFTSPIKEVTAGTYKDGKWTESGKVTVKNNTFTAESGLAYRIVL